MELVPRGQPAGRTSACSCCDSSRWTRRRAAGKGLGAGARNARHRATAGARREPQGQPAGVGPPLAPRDGARPCRSQGPVCARAGARAAGRSRRTTRKPSAARVARGADGEPRGPARVRSSCRETWRRGALAKALDALAEIPRLAADAQDFDSACARRPGQSGAAPPPVIFLKNVLIREPGYRAALAAVSTPRSEVGEPLPTVSLRDPDPGRRRRRAAHLLDVEVAPAVAAGTSWAGAVWLTGEGARLWRRPRVCVLGAASTVPFPGRRTSAPGPRCGRRRSELRLSHRPGAGGRRPACSCCGRTRRERLRRPADAKLPAEVAARRCPACGPRTSTRTAISISSGTRDGPPVVLRNNGDGTFPVAAPFGRVAAAGLRLGRFRRRRCADAALLDAEGVLRVFLNLRGARVPRGPLPPVPARAAIAAAELTGDASSMCSARRDGTVDSPVAARERWSSEAVGWRDRSAAGLAPGRARLLVADLDNNGASDLVISAPRLPRAARRRRPILSSVEHSTLAGRITAAAISTATAGWNSSARRDGAQVVRVKARTITGRRSGRAR